MEASVSLRGKAGIVAVIVGICLTAGLSGALVWGCAPQGNDVSRGELMEDSITSKVSSETGNLTAAKKAYSLTEKQDSGTCATCHTSLDALETAKSSAEVEANQYLVNEAYPNTLHGSLGCISCHSGDNQASDATSAHGNMTVYPTADGGKVACGTCHTDIVDRAETSLHYTTRGLEFYFENRLKNSGNEGENIGEQCFRTEGCPDCHADCGQCHIRNAAKNNIGQAYTGLIDGHMFIGGDNPSDAETTCMSCHGGSITKCFTEDDVHGPNGAQLGCMDCHSETDVHGTGEAYTTLHDQGAVMAECADCHDASRLKGEWHEAKHLDNATCESCHNVPYRTCTNCHGWGAASRGDKPFQSEDKVTLGYYHGGKITTLVKGPVDTNMLNDMGITLDAEKLNTQSSWYGGFAHGIVVPDITQEFCDRCHGAGTDLLKKEELQFPDYEIEHLVDPLPKVNAQAAKTSK